MGSLVTGIMTTPDRTAPIPRHCRQLIGPCRKILASTTVTALKLEPITEAWLDASVREYAHTLPSR